jgi:hypothetical protein
MLYEYESIVIDSEAGLYEMISRVIQERRQAGVLPWLTKQGFHGIQ